MVKALTVCFLSFFMLFLWQELMKIILKDELNISKVQFGNNQQFARLALYNLKVESRGFKK